MKIPQIIHYIEECLTFKQCINWHLDLLYLLKNVLQEFELPLVKGEKYIKFCLSKLKDLLMTKQ